MPAPIGNKNALGCKTSGQPCKFNKDLEFAELEKWSKTEDALVFRMFPLLRGYSHDTLQRWAEENVEYCDIYNRAKALVGVRRELRLIKSDSATPFQRYATYYDEQLHAHERAEKKFDADLKKEIEGSKQTTYILEVPPGLAIGSNIPTSSISAEYNQSPKSGD